MKLSAIVISLSALNDKKIKRVFVLNRTTGSEKGRVIITVPKSNGSGNDTLNIPSTFVPIELTAIVNKEQLLHSSEFKNAMASGLIVAINAEAADKLLETNEAKEEIKKLKKEDARFKDSVSNVKGIEIVNQGTQSMLDSAGEEPTSKIRPQVMQLTSDLEDTKDEDSAISTLRNTEKLRSRELSYLIKNTNKKYKKFIGICTTMLEKKKNKSKAA